MNDRAWYHDGLRFQCTGCGRCCTGAPGYVYVTKSEIKTLAAALGLEVSEFEEAFVRPVGRRESLVELPNGDCVFYDNPSRRCRVYEVRPLQCRTWPFWRSNLRSAEAWERTCRACPGSGRGRLVTPEKIETQMSVIRM
ncbi:MAG TPA: YkgJ family cysteine cluster protein [Thermoguttaceae bacterium]|nr:YkgJ family cysteine cluster protein [Thermoguttaceae bacterium]